MDGIKRNAKEASNKQVIKNEYLSSLKKLKGNPKDKKLKANVIEKRFSLLYEY